METRKGRLERDGSKGARLFPTAIKRGSHRQRGSRRREDKKERMSEGREEGAVGL
jgi:hypothetical protein